MRISRFLSSKTSPNATKVLIFAIESKRIKRLRPRAQAARPTITPPPFEDAHTHQPEKTTAPKYVPLLSFFFPLLAWWHNRDRSLAALAALTEEESYELTPPGRQIWHEQCRNRTAPQA